MSRGEKLLFALAFGLALSFVGVALMMPAPKPTGPTLEERVVAAEARADAAEAAADSAMRLANECAAQVSRNNARVDGVDARLRAFEREYPLGTGR